MSRNFYWLSRKVEALEWDKSTWYHTPTKSFADYTALNGLPMTDLNLSARSQQQGTYRVTTITVTNPGKTIAFAVHLKVLRAAGGEEVLPVLWQDNYFPLLPGESRQITATYTARESARRGRSAEEGEQPAALTGPVVEVDGWNVRPKVVSQ